MKMYKNIQYSIAIILYILIQVCESKRSWCDPKLCQPGVRHVACKNPGYFSSQCPRDAKIIDTSYFKPNFLHEHNKLRSLLGMGFVSGYKPAAKMATMLWDDELAYLAELNLKKCDFNHDKCYNTYRFRNTGQSLAGVWSDPQLPLNMTRLISEAIEGWFSEHSLIDMSYITNFRVDSNFEDYGHFTEMAVARNNHVGCAAIRFTMPSQPRWIRINIACNYASVHSYDLLYEPGTPGSKCRTGRNPYYPGLCSPREYFNPNLYNYN